MKATIIEIIKESAGIKTFILEPKEKYKFIAGQYASFSIKKDERTISRIFSISCAPEKETISFTTIISESDFKQEINKYTGGEEIEVSKPMGDFTLEKSKGKEIVFLAGGIGITPVKSMIDHLSHVSEQPTITLLYGNKTFDRIVFKKELENYKAELNNFKLVHILSMEENVPSGAEKGRIDSQIFQKYISNVANKIVYIVGPPAFVEGMKLVTKEMHLLKINVITENFTGYLLEKTL